MPPLLEEGSAGLAVLSAMRMLAAPHASGFSDDCHRH
jgi:hypothetical protein